MRTRHYRSGDEEWQKVRRANFSQAVAQRCREAREAAGLKRPDLAKMCHLSTHTIVNLEEGAAMPALVLALVAEALDVTIDALVPLDATNA